jgi:hypothetical protein
LPREIDRALDRAPDPIRYRPLRCAVWRALLLQADFVVWTFYRQSNVGRLATKPVKDPGALQVMAYALVTRAILGEIRASTALLP